jgi:hypothetical protein
VKLGTENRTTLYLACGLMLVAVILGWRFIGSMGWGSSSAAAPAAAGAANPGTEIPAGPGTDKGQLGGKKPVSSRSLDPTLRFDLLKSSEDTKYEGAGRDVFRVFVEPPPRPVAPVITNQQAQASSGPPPTPPPPPIDLKFYGFAISKPGESKRIFLSQGEDVFIAKEGDIVDRRYKVVRISPNSVEILDVLSNNRQSIPLSG